MYYENTSDVLGNIVAADKLSLSCRKFILHHYVEVCLIYIVIKSLQMPWHRIRTKPSSATMLTRPWLNYNSEHATHLSCIAW